MENTWNGLWFKFKYVCMLPLPEHCFCRSCATTTFFISYEYKTYLKAQIYILNLFCFFPKQDKMITCIVNLMQIKDCYESVIRKLRQLVMVAAQNAFLYTGNSQNMYCYVGIPSGFITWLTWINMCGGNIDIETTLI